MLLLYRHMLAMNMFHRLCCSSNYWARAVERQLLPWALTDVESGECTLEIGPGYGANLRVLVDKTPSLACVEIDEPMADRLRERSRARVITGDGTATGLPDAEFSSGGVLHDTASRADAAAAGPVVRRGFSGAGTGRSLRRQRRGALAGVPDRPYRRHLQPGVARDAARPAAPCRVHRRARGHQGRRAALARD